MNELSEKTSNYKSLYGPSFRSGEIATDDEWRDFFDKLDHESAKVFADIWFEKAKAADGIPLRKDFSFEELVKYGSQIYIARYNDDGLWETTFCGNGIVENVGFDATGKTLNDFGSDETLEFWLGNLDRMVKEFRIFIEYYTLEFTNKDYLHCTAVNLPLRSGKTDHPDMQMVYEIFTSKSLIPIQTK